jgi:catalase
MGGFTSYAERIDARKIRARSASFFDHFSQATLFFNSQSEPEQNHIVNALRFELGKVETAAIRERMLFLLSQVDKTLAKRVAEGLGATVPAKLDQPMNMSVPADGDPKKFQPRRVTQAIATSPALRMIDNPNFPKGNIKTRKIAFLVADGFDDTDCSEMKQALLTAGAAVMTVAPRLGMLTGADGEQVKADFSFLTGSSVLFDAVYVPGGEDSVASLKKVAEAGTFLREAYKHCKTVAASGAGVELLESTGIISQTSGKDGKADRSSSQAGIVASREAAAGKLSPEFIKAIGQHRHWEREASL